MRTKSSQSGLSLVELTVVILVFGILITSVIYGLRAVENAKVKSFVVQMNLYKNAASSFREQYGTWPGDFSNARNMIDDCTAARQCADGNGDQIVASSNNSNSCQMPNFSTGETAFPCTPGAGSSVDNQNEMTQFWRHLALSKRIGDLRMRRDRYAWGDSMPKTRLVGGIQVIYEGNRNNNYVNGLTGHFFTMSRDTRVLTFNMDAAGNGMISTEIARRLDYEMDDALPNTGNFRTVGSWGCGGAGQTNEYSGTALRQCTSFYKFDP